MLRRGNAEWVIVAGSAAKREMTACSCHRIIRFTVEIHAAYLDTLPYIYKYIYVHVYFITRLLYLHVFIYIFLHITHVYILSTLLPIIKWHRGEIETINRVLGVTDS